ncbi:glycosyltransferase family 2 protein [bacterium]|nr:glycosyltransferase family 2 protein [bacterium]
MKVSIVIPTRNRLQNLKRLLQSLSSQTNIHEVIVVDASDIKLSPSDIDGFHLPICICYTQPSVCHQRNFGIQRSKSEWILLCDDDIELPKDYLQRLSIYALKNKEAVLITGLFLEKNIHNEWSYEYPVSFKGLIWNFIFQLPLWTNLNNIPKGFIKNFYTKRRNTFTLAGWPLVTDFQYPSFKTSIYSLGAALVQRKILLQIPFDEILDSNGIGDNYGVAIQIPQEQPFHILMNTYVYHHKSPINRLNRHISYGRRILALDYFMRKSGRFSYLNFMFLLWSIVGNFVRQTLTWQWNLAFTSGKIFFLLLLNRNSYRIRIKTVNK